MDLLYAVQFVMVITLVEITASQRYSFLCGTVKAQERGSVCNCTLLYTSNEVDANCTMTPWLKDIPTFVTRLSSIMRRIDMTHTSYCNRTNKTPSHVVCHNNPCKSRLPYKSVCLLHLTRCRTCLVNSFLYIM